MDKALKPKFNFTQDKSIKINISLPQSVQEIINDYIDFYHETTDERITPDVLFSQLIPDALSKDKNFIKWRKEKGKK